MRPLSCVAHGHRLLPESLRPGGLRDPLNPWDFYDVDGDKRVNAIDINKVRSKAFQDFPPYDRGMGAAPWAPGPPDGIVNAVDVGHVRASVNHYCVDPP